MTALSLGTRARLGLSVEVRHGAPPAAFSPASLAGLAFWYDAAISPAVETGGAIEQWQDLSGQANHALQPAAVQRPLRGVDPAGRDFLQFDGVDDALVVDSPPDLSAGATAFVVFRMRERADFSGVLAAGDGVAADEAGYFAFANGTAASRELQLTARVGEADPLLLAGVDAGEVQFAVLTIAADAGALRDLNGEAGDSQTTGVLGTPAAIALGARLDGPNLTGSAALDLYEVGLYAGVLPPQDLDRLESYLRGRHGLAWTPLHLGAELAWFHDVSASPFVLAGDDVVRWSDLGPEGRHWQQDGGGRPALATDAADRATVRFDGTGDVLLLDGVAPALEPFTAAVVCAVRTPGDFAGILSAAPASGADVGTFWSLLSIDGAVPQVSLQGRALEPDPLTLTFDDPGAPALVLWTTGAGAAELEVAASSAADTYEGAFGTPAELVLGGRYDGAPFGYAAIDVYATLGVRRALTTPERQRLAAWAQSRWEL